MSSVVGLHLSGGHEFSKRSVEQIELIAGVGVAGDAYAGPLVQHRSRVAADPQQPNLGQVHLTASELFAVLESVGQRVEPGQLRENITTACVDPHELAVGTTLRLGDQALVAVTGRRNPCAQIDTFRPGLLKHLARRRVRRGSSNGCSRRVALRHHGSSTWRTGSRTSGPGSDATRLRAVGSGRSHRAGRTWSDAARCS